MNQDKRVYIPMIMKSGSRVLTRPGFVVGASVGTVLDAEIYSRLNLGIVGMQNFLWSRFEPAPGEYEWEYMRAYFHSFYSAKALGIPSLVTIFGVPRWAQVDQEVGDSPMRVDCIPSFVNVLRHVARSVPEMVYMQVLNEPDNPEGYEEHYGCLGDVSLYLEIMRQVVEIKSEFPHLILSTALTTYTTDFFQGFVDGGGGAFIDQLHVHFYNGWGQVSPPLLSDELLAIRQWFDCPVWVTEANLLHDDIITPEYLAGQSKWVIDTGWLAKKLGFVVYMPYALFSGWRSANILGRPVEKELAEMTAQANSTTRI